MEEEKPQGDIIDNREFLMNWNVLMNLQKRCKVSCHHFHHHYWYPYRHCGLRWIIYAEKMDDVRVTQSATVVAFS